MEIKTTNPKHTPPLKAIVSHKGVEKIFQISSFNKSNFIKGFDIFEQLNLYFKQLSEKQQDYLFDLYSKSHEILDRIDDPDKIEKGLREVVSVLFDSLDYYDIAEFVRSNSIIVTPPGLAVEYVNKLEIQTTREQTYILSDYVDLIPLTIMVKGLIPIWGEYINNTKRTHGTANKEFAAYSLISKSKVNHLPPLTKLREYVEHTIGDNSNVKVLEGVSAADFPEQLLSLVMVRRITIADIRGTDPQDNLLTYLHRFIKSKIGGTGRFSYVKDKAVSQTDSSDEQNRLSAIEMFRNTESLSRGDTVEVNYFGAKYERIIKRIDPSLTTEEIEKGVQSVEELRNKPITQVHVLMLQWGYQQVLSPESIMYLDKTNIVNLIGAMKAFLLKNDFVYLALLISSFAETDTDTVILGASDARARLTSDHNDKLAKLFPFQNVSGGVKTGTIYKNQATEAIDILVGHVDNGIWVATDLELLRGYNKSKRLLNVSGDIKNQLASWIINIVNRRST